MVRNMFSASTVVRHLWIILLVVAITNAKAIVKVTPRYIIAAAGTDVRINCTVNSNEPVLWETKPFDKNRSQSVYDGKKFLDNFSESGRFSLDRNSRPGSRDLLIRKVELNDAGSFSCIVSTKQFSDLIVTDQIACAEKDPARGRMGENEFGLRQSILEFHCSLNFRGNKRPVFCWFLNDDPMPGISTSPIIADKNSTIASGEINSFVAVKKLNSNVVAATAVIDQCGFNSTNVGWKSKPLDIKFAALENHPAEECPAVDSSLMCNPWCTYEQHQRDDGSYYCQTNYTLDKKNYHLQVNSTRRASDYHFVIIVVQAGFLVIYFVVTAPTLLWHFKDDIIKILGSIRTDLWGVDGQSNVDEQSNDNPTQEEKSFTPTEPWEFDGHSNAAKQRIPKKVNDITQE